ncbi:MAG: FMN-binding negative transcriptional regulator [Propionibacteriaceae bacterium]|nr:FMN-binding negative transcriptional regulator [Propionibacteriaceae bacterium]
MTLCATVATSLAHVHVPDHFRLPDDRLHEFLSTVRPGNLVTVHEDGPLATFVPIHLEEREGERHLVTHLVRNNPQVRTPVTGPGMVIIDIADAYISPLWYATNDQLPNVPTWDYITIHAWGTVKIDLEPTAALRAARELTSRMEPGDVLEKVGDHKLGLMSRAIVAVELTVERLVGKAKMSQNRHPDDIRALIERLDGSAAPEITNYLREVSLPHAEKRFGTIERLQTRGRPVAAHGTIDPADKG